MKRKLNIVWLKRDLRTQDHIPFEIAESAEEDYFVVYMYEPYMMQYPDTSLRHQQFVYHSIVSMNEKLEKYNRKVQIFQAEAPEVFHYLCNEYDVQKVFSYQESGTKITWQRDKAVKRLLLNNNVQWEEFQRDGVIRGIKNRSNWEGKWTAHVHTKPIRNQYSESSFQFDSNPFPLKMSFLVSLLEYPISFQKPGSDFAWKYLYSFCADRGKNYNRHISKPLQSRKSCARISPYLAWGNITIRQVYSYVMQHENYYTYKKPFVGLLTRLKWHCHFIQKFEMECAYETSCINRGYELMSTTRNDEFIDAWKEGRTGIPMVDANMRCLRETGWINFRMRAMLVSVFCHHMDCDWRDGVYHIARLFLDYDPGIHYPQFQMAAGTTGVNTVRMYNPIKQSKDHDPKGVFIKMWIPELRNMPEEFIHEPWKMTEMDRVFNGIDTDYPSPILDIEETAKLARDKIWGHRDHPKVQEENSRILRTHVVNTMRRRQRNS